MIFLLLDIDILSAHNSVPAEIRREDITVNVSGPDSESEADFDKNKPSNEKDAGRVYATRSGFVRQ
jgi:hypothetical protein